VGWGITSLLEVRGRRPRPLDDGTTFVHLTLISGPYATFKPLRLAPPGFLYTGIYTTLRLGQESEFHIRIGVEVSRTLT
jgi:hypothetical protein